MNTKLINPSMLVVVGFIFGMFTTALGALKLGQLEIYTVNLALIVVVALYPFAWGRAIPAKIWCVSLGMVLYGLVYLSLKREADALSLQVMLVATGVLFVYLLLDFLSRGMRISRSLIASWVGKRSVIVIAIAAAFAILLFRAADVALMALPNEQRSIYLFGMEFHHINFGLILLLVMDLLRRELSQGAAVLANLVIGFALGMVIDQTAYYALAEITDESYRSAVSLWGAIVCYVFCVGIWYWNAESTRSLD